MSWLARSIANTLKLDDDDDANPSSNDVTTTDTPEHRDGATSSPRGVKEDLSEITKTLTRQFWGVASFLAPPPETSEEKSEPDPDAVSEGIRSDFAEIGGRFRSGISKLSNNINVSEITKMASTFLQLGSDDEDDGRKRGSDDSSVVGVTEEVVAFARDIAMHPETWLDFPLPHNDDGDDDDDFDLSDAQQEHALAVEHLAPRLAALRIELCPGYMSEATFWKIYFVLLHPRLSKQDAELLSTPQIVKARASLMTELKNRAKLDVREVNESSIPKDTATSYHESSLSAPSAVPTVNEINKAPVPEVGTKNVFVDTETLKDRDGANEIQIVDKSVIQQEDVQDTKVQILKSGSSNVYEEKDEDEDDGDDWLKEESSEIAGASGTSNVPIENDDDVSFSDLEEDDDVPAVSKKVKDSSDKDSRDWVQLRKNSSDSSKDGDVKHSGEKDANANDTEESSGWLDIDDIDEGLM